MATSSGSEPTLVRVTVSLVLPPKDLNSTSGKVLFIALHMMNVRMRPEAPTSDPATMRTGLEMMKPVKAAAIPDSELRSETTTGMSAPPMGSTNTIPSKQEMPMMAHK